MPRVWCSTKLRQWGFSSVEALLAATLFGLLVIPLTGAFIYVRSSGADAGDHTRSLLLASEGLEAVRSIRDEGFADVATGTYGLVKSCNSWSLAGSQDVTGKFTRHITVANGSANRKTVTAAVSWASGVHSSQSTLVTQLTNWRLPFTAPSWPLATLTGSVDVAGNQDATGVATQGNYAYLIRATGSPNFVVMDITNRAAPTMVGSLNLGGAPTSVYACGNYVYVGSTSSTAEIQVVSVANPAVPSLVRSVNLSGSADVNSLTVSGAYLYATRKGTATIPGFQVLSLADPSNPAYVGGYGTSISMQDVYVSGNYAYVTTSTNNAELLVLNVSVPALPQLTTSMDFAGTTDGGPIAGFGNMVYVGQGAVLHAVNVTTPASPSLAGSYTAAANIDDLAIDINDPTYLFMGTAIGAGELQVMQVANPAAITVARSIDIPAGTELLGVAYNRTRNIVVGAANANTTEGVIFGPN